MQHTASLAKKLVRIGASLLVVALISIGLTLWVTWQLEGGAAAVNEAGRMRMQTWRLVSSVQAGLEMASIFSFSYAKRMFLTRDLKYPSWGCDVNARHHAFL